MADGQIELPGFGGSGEVESEITRIMALEGQDRARELYVMLLGMRLSGERTTITVDKNHLLVLKCVSQMSGVSMAEILAYLVSAAAEQMSSPRANALGAIIGSVEDMAAAMDGIEAQLDAATDAVLVNAYGNLSAIPRPSEEGERKLNDRLAEIGGAEDAQ